MKNTYHRRAFNCEGTTIIIVRFWQLYSSSERRLPHENTKKQKTQHTRWRRRTLQGLLTNLYHQRLAPTHRYYIYYAWSRRTDPRLVGERKRGAKNAGPGATTPTTCWFCMRVPARRGGVW